jgi:hypothetical protein
MTDTPSSCPNSEWRFGERSHTYQDFEVKAQGLVSGGGIGGLTLAVSLAQYPDIDVQVYEAAGKLAEIGAGVMIWGRTWKILTSLGLAESLRSVAGGPTDKDIGAVHFRGRRAAGLPNTAYTEPDFGFEFRRSDRPEGFSFFRLSLPCTYFDFCPPLRREQPVITLTTTQSSAICSTERTF